MVRVETDVLIIGGGLAGCMAAIRAREYGVRVTIAEKSNTMCSGQAGSGIDHMWAYIPEIHGKMGWRMEDAVEDHVQGIAHGFARRDILRLIARDSYSRLLDLERWGLTIRYSDSKLPGGFRIVNQFHSVPTALNVDGRPVKAILTKEAKRRGVEIVNRITMTDLLVADGEIAGAAGVGTRDGRIYLFKAKSVILSSGGKTGRLDRELTGVDFNHHLPATLCGDGKAMALRAGLPVMNMEFLSPRRFAVANYDISGGLPRNTWLPVGSVINGRGEQVVPRTNFYDWGDLEKGYQIDAEASRKKWMAANGEVSSAMASVRESTDGPFWLDCTNGTEEEIRYVEWTLSNEGKCRQFLRHLKEENVDLRRDKLELGPQSREIGNLSCAGLMVDSDLETALKGLFAAGDEIGGVPFSASSGAYVTGWLCGEAAAERAQRLKGFLHPDMEKTELLGAKVSGMLGAKKGHTWKEVECGLHHAVETYCGEVRTAEMLNQGIARLEELQSVQLSASNPHELGRCLEVGFLLTNAEMVIRASLERKESRRHPMPFRRADFPEQDDANWFVFSALSLENGRYKFEKIPIM